MVETAVAPPATQRLSTAVRARILLAFFAFILIGASDAAVGVLLPSLREHYGVDKGTISIIFLCGTGGYLFSAFGSGLLLEKFGQRIFMMLGPAILMLGALTISQMPPFILLMAGFLLSGFGVGLIDAGLNAYIAALPNNTALLNYLHAFYGVGALLGPLLATGVLSYALGWNTVYFVWVAAAGILVLGLAAAFKKNSDDIEEHHENSSEGKQGNVLAAALKLRVVWVAALFLLAYVGIEVSLGSWTFSFLTEERDQTVQLSGFAVSGYWLGLTVGRLVLGRVAARLGNRRLIEMCLVGVVIGILLVWLVPVSIVMAVGLWLVGFSLGPVFPTTIAMMSDIVPARILPSAIGFVASFGSMGAALLPAVAGNLAEHLGLWVLLPYCIVLTVFLLAFWVLLQRRHTT
ncbi:MAG: MFS transporter [Chloroflexota bacterium]